MPKKNKISVHNDKINYTFEYDEIINVQDGIKQISTILKHPLLSSDHFNSYNAQEWDEINKKFFAINTLLQAIYNAAKAKGPDKVQGLENRIIKAKLFYKLKNLSSIQNNVFGFTNRHKIMPPGIFNMYGNVINTLQTGDFNCYSGVDDPDFQYQNNSRDFIDFLQNEYNFFERSDRELDWQKRLIEKLTPKYVELPDEQSKVIFKEIIKPFAKQAFNLRFVNYHSYPFESIDITTIINLLKKIAPNDDNKRQALVSWFQKFIEVYLNPENHLNYETINTNLNEIISILEHRFDTHKDLDKVIPFLMENKIYSKQKIEQVIIYDLLRKITTDTPGLMVIDSLLKNFVNLLIRDDIKYKDLLEIISTLKHRFDTHKDLDKFIPFLMENKIYSKEKIEKIKDIASFSDMQVELEADRLFANQQHNQQYDVRGTQEEKYQFINSYIKLRNKVPEEHGQRNILQNFVINSLHSNKDSYKHLSEVIKMLDDRLNKGNNNKDYDFNSFIQFLNDKNIYFNKSGIINGLINTPNNQLHQQYAPFVEEIKKEAEKKIVKPLNNQTVHGKEEESSLADAIDKLKKRYYKVKLTSSIPPKDDLIKVIAFLRIKLQSFIIEDKDKEEWANIKRVIEANFNNLSNIDLDLKARATNLLWLAVCALEDRVAATEVLKHEPSDEDMQERWLGWFKSAIVDSQLAYRRDRGDMSYPSDSELNKDKSCMGGNLNRIIDALNLIHPDVEIKAGQETSNNMANYLEKQGEAKINDFGQNKMIDITKKYLEELSLTELISIKKELTNWTNAYENEQEYTSPAFNTFKVNLTRYILDAAEIELGPVIVNRITGRNDTDKLIKFIDPAAFDVAAEKIKDIVSQHSRAGILFSPKENQKNQQNNPIDPKRRKSI